MSIPREGSRDTGKGIIVSIYPDVCFAKKDPVPFSVYAIQGEDANTAPTVRMTGQRAHNKDSMTTCCHGDEPGVAGVKSGTVGSVCQPKTWSETVRIEGKPAVRHNDEWWMNNKNTVGKLAWIETTETFEPTPPIKEYQVAAATAAAALAVAPAGQTGASANPLGRPSPLPSPKPPVSSPGEVIYPDIEQWKKDAPKPDPKLRWWNVLKWARRGSGIGTFLGGVLIPSNGYVINDRIPLDATEQALQNEAQRMLNDGSGRTEVYRWYDEAVLQHRQQLQQPTTETHAPPVPHTKTDDNVSIRQRCRFITICFDSKKYDPKEYARQLRMQQDGINAMSPAKWLANRMKFEIPGMPNQLRKDALPFQNATREAYERQYGPGSTAGLAALHRVDLVAGGDYFDVPDMGDANINSSLGPSWKGRRVERVKRHAQEQLKNGCPSVMVILSSAPDCIGTEIA